VIENVVYVQRKERRAAGGVAGVGALRVKVQCLVRYKI
jgi:hypothetical protein